jgi:hypothetical protein
MFLPAESLKKPQVGLAALAPSAQVTPVWPPVLTSACSRQLRMFNCNSSMGNSYQTSAKAVAMRHDTRRCAVMLLQQAVQLHMSIARKQISYNITNRTIRRTSYGFALKERAYRSG